MARVQAKRIISTLISFSALLSFSAFSQDVFKCTDDNDKGLIMLQDVPCDKGLHETKVPMPTFKQNEHTVSLRPAEIASLEQVNEQLMMSKYFELDTRSLAKLANQQFKHDMAYERLRHKHAKEMFDKSYHHFFTYGVANGNGSFPVGYAPGGFNQDFTDFNDTNQGVNTGDVVYIDSVGNTQQGGTVGNQNN